MTDSMYGIPHYGESLYGAGLPRTPATGRIAWTFYDGSIRYELPVNPDSAKMPTKEKKVTIQATAAGTQIIYEGRKDPKKISFSGVILEEAQYNSFKEWVNTNKQIQITDDLGQKFWVYLTTFSPKRRKSIDYAWLMDYSVEGFVLDR